MHKPMLLTMFTISLLIKIDDYCYTDRKDTIGAKWRNQPKLACLRQSFPWWFVVGEISEEPSPLQGYLCHLSSGPQKRRQFLLSPIFICCTNDDKRIMLEKNFFHL